MPRLPWLPWLLLWLSPVAIAAASAGASAGATEGAATAASLLSSDASSRGRFDMEGLSVGARCARVRRRAGKGLGGWLGSVITPQVGIPRCSPLHGSTLSARPRRPSTHPTTSRCRAPRKKTRAARRLRRPCREQQTRVWLRRQASRRPLQILRDAFLLHRSKVQHTLRCARHPSFQNQ